MRALGLVAGSLLLGLVWELRAAVLRWLLVALIVLRHAVPAAKWITLGRRGRNQVSLELGGEAFLPPNATLRRGAAPGLAPDGALVVEMPQFAWLAGRLRARPLPTK